MYSCVMKRFVALPLLLVASALFGADSWESFQYATRRLTVADVSSRSLEDLRRMRGIVFGKHGRVFGSDPDIDRYLRAQPWYAPLRTFDNTDLNEIEHANLDVIRLAEAARHPHVQPGDMRYWQTRELAEAKLGPHSGAELRVLEAEIEAIHGKVFNSSPTLQHYFEARYWYHIPEDEYDPKMLSAIERHNMEVIAAAIRRQRKLVLLPGELGPFMDKPIKREMLDGLGLHELRLLRNEIYARHGYEFRTPWLANWFSGHEWYEVKSGFRAAQLTAVQRENIRVINARERELHEALSTAKIDTASLEGLFTEDLRRLRNEIYARHGRPFKDSELRGYFTSFDWYKPDPKFREASLSPIERANAAAILRLEEGAESRIIFEG